MSAPVSQAITRKSASNLALAFCLLPADRRRAMAALYAFCRGVDDVADEDAVPESDRRAQLQDWREDIRAACHHGSPRLPVNRELQPVIERFGLPFEEFDELIRGCEMDLDTKRYPDWPALDLYCYRVASVVGLLSVRIFGGRHESCRDYAVSLGKALQLTNILRDIGNDARRGRIYVPQCELAAHGVTEDSILNRQPTSGFSALAAALADRARAFYRQAREALPAPDRRALVAAELMGAVYWRLLEKIERTEYAVLEGPLIRLGKPTKLALIVRTWWRLRTNCPAPNYGPA